MNKYLSNANFIWNILQVFNIGSVFNFLSQ